MNIKISINYDRYTRTENEGQGDINEFMLYQKMKAGGKCFMTGRKLVEPKNQRVANAAMDKYLNVGKKIMRI